MHCGCNLRLHSTICNIANRSLSCRAIFISYSFYQLYIYFNLLKLVVEPNSLLLEDRRGETSSEEHNPTNTLPLMKLALVKLDIIP